MDSEMLLDMLNDIPDEDILITAEKMKIGVGTESDDNKETKNVQKQSDTE